MSLNIPFETEPTPESKLVGNRAIGVLKLPKLYGLSRNELEFVEAHYDYDVQSEMGKLAREIASSSKVKTKFVTIYNQLYRFVFNGSISVDELKAEFLGEHFNRALALQNELNKQLKRKNVVYAAALLKYRLGVECTIADLENPDNIKPMLIEELANFAYREQSGWRDEAGSDPELSEDELGEFSAA